LPYIMPHAFPNAAGLFGLPGQNKSADKKGMKKGKGESRGRRGKVAQLPPDGSDDECGDEPASEAGDGGINYDGSERDEEEKSESDASTPPAKKPKAKAAKSSPSSKPASTRKTSSPSTDVALTLSIEAQARKERDWDIEKEKRELLFQDMGKELREDLRNMREKYDSIIKFDSAIHISLEECRERLKQKQDECDHYVDSKLYEKQKAFDRQFAELKIDAKRTEDNYSTTMDTYKDVVGKLDAECHKLEAGWTDTQQQFEKYKTETQQALGQLKEEKKVETTALKDELEELKSEYNIAAEQKAAQYARLDEDLRRIKAMNVEKIKINTDLEFEIKETKSELGKVKSEAHEALLMLKTVTADKDIAEQQVERQKLRIAALTEEVETKDKKYSDIVEWAKTTEQKQRVHDDELKKNMNQQHDKFNVEYDFLHKQSSALKDEIRILKHEVDDHKALLARSLDQLKSLHRDNDAKVLGCKQATDRADKAEALVDGFDKKLGDTMRKAALLRDRDLKLAEAKADETIRELKSKLELKEKVIEEMESKTVYLRTKIKGLEEILLQTNRKVSVLEEQMLFEGRMRELNMQKRAEHENGGIDAIVQLLKIHETNSANLDRIQTANTMNLDTVRKDIAVLVSQLSKEVKKNAEKGTTQLKAAAHMIGQMHLGHRDEEETAEPSPEELVLVPSRPIDLTKAFLGAPDLTSIAQPEAPDVGPPSPQMFKDGFGNMIGDPFDKSRGFTPEVPPHIMYQQQQLQYQHQMLQFAVQQQMQQQTPPTQGMIPGAQPPSQAVGQEAKKVSFSTDKADPASTEACASAPVPAPASSVSLAPQAAATPAKIVPIPPPGTGGPEALMAAMNATTIRPRGRAPAIIAPAPVAVSDDGIAVGGVVKNFSRKKRGSSASPEKKDPAPVAKGASENSTPNVPAPEPDDGAKVGEQNPSFTRKKRG